MNIERIGEPQIVMSNPLSKHNYFGWPSIARLKNGKIAIASSGFRLAHVCPFGKGVMALSDDEGDHYTAPFPVIDTVLDDRDAGLTPFGESGLIFTSFNNNRAFQRECNARNTRLNASAQNAYIESYLNTITPEEENQVLGATFRISHDNGYTFGPLHLSPITSPHGPTVLSDGTILWVGRTFSANDLPTENECVAAYWLHPEDGSMEYAGKIENIPGPENENLLSCEPHALQLPDGRIICHIRVQGNVSGERKFFTIYQSESSDQGRTWTRPHPILPDLGGAPPHLMLHSSGALICGYARRAAPAGIRMMFSLDGGKTWDTDHVLYEAAFEGPVASDLGYPATIELEDHSLLTIFYAHPQANMPAVIMQQKWRIQP